MDTSWFFNILNSLFTFLDRIVYGLISYLYQLLLYLANLDLFDMNSVTDAASTGSTSNIIIQFSSRVYALLGIFMLFKVSFSLIQYIVNPESFSDQQKGVGKLVTNIMVSLILVITVPYIFSYAFKIQGIILQSNIIGNLIMGNTTGSSSEETNQEQAEDLQFMLYSSFFTVNTDLTSLDSCKNGPALGTRAMAEADGCLEALSNIVTDGANKLGDFFKQDNGVRRFDAFGEVVNDRDPDTNEYIFKYMPIVSTIAGGFVVVMLLSFCMDVAVRAIKLGFLEIISPIPIISYMDPKQGKDGMFSRWVHECLSTYASLFIRLAVIYFVFFLIQQIANIVLADPTNADLYLNGEAPSDPLMGVFIRVMVILGIFMFAKQVPKLIEELIPGMKGSGEFSISPLKKLQGTAATGIIGGIAGAGIGGVAGALSSVRTAELTGENKFKSAFSGAAQGIIGGVSRGKNWDAKNLSSLASAPMSMAGDIARYQAAKHGTTFKARRRAIMDNALGAPQAADIMKQRIDNGNRYVEKINGYNNLLLTKANKAQQGQFSGPNATSDYNTISQYKYLKQEYDAAVAKGDAVKQRAILNGTFSDHNVSMNGTRFTQFEDKAADTMHKVIQNGTFTQDDDTKHIEDEFNTIVRIGKENSSTPEFKSINASTYNSVTNMKSTAKTVDVATKQLENSNDYEDAKQAAEAVKADNRFHHMTGR